MIRKVVDRQYHDSVLGGLIFFNDTLWLHVLAQRLVLDVVAKSFRSTYCQPSWRLCPSWRTGDSQDGHSEAILELRDTQGLPGPGVEDANKILGEKWDGMSATEA